MAEGILRSMAGTPFNAFSAGSHPKGSVNRLAIEVLKKNRISTEGLYSKDWTEFSKPDSPRLDFVFTVCDKAAGEVCPVWPGQPIVAHWGSPDPAAAEGTEAQRKYAFVSVASQIFQRISLFCAFSDEKLEPIAIKRIGEQFKIEGEAEMKR